jgi:multidrug efflux pump subunit AcrB
VRRIITYFVNYPKAINILVLFFIVFGTAGTLALKSSFYPLIDPKFIEISAILPGASPEEVEEGIVMKIEENLKGMEGVDRYYSASRENIGYILVETLEDSDVDNVLVDVKNAVDKVPSFPVDLEPIVVKKMEQQEPTFIFSLTAENIGLSSLKNISKKIEVDLRNLNGISQISTSGFSENEIEISVNEKLLSKYNLTFYEILDAVQKSNIIVSGGTIKTNKERFLIRSNNKNYYSNELNEIVVKSFPSGNNLKLGDVSNVYEKFSDDEPQLKFIDNKSSVIMTVLSTKNEDLLESADKIRLYIEDFNKKNKNIQLIKLKDYSEVLRQRTNLLLENGGLGILLVLGLLSLFLNTRLAFWVAFGLPISFLGMLIFAGNFNITINIMSLFGMIVVIGILVDDAIVIAENIYKHFESGKSAADSAVDGTLEVLPAIVSAIITTIISFATLLLLAGDVGNFFGEVAMIVIITLLVSLIEALIILPSHLAHSNALQRKKEDKDGILFTFFSTMKKLNQKGYRVMDWLRDKIYTPMLRFGLEYRFLSLSGFIAALMLTVSSVFGGVISMTFFPTIASDFVTVDLKMPMGTSTKVTDSIINVIEKNAIIAGNELEEKYMKDDERKLIQNIQKNIGNYADNLEMVAGVGNIEGSSVASLEIYMLDSEERTQDIQSSMLASLIRKKTGTIAGAEKFIINDGANFGGSPVAISLLSNNKADLKNAKDDLIKNLKSNPILVDVAHNDPQGLKEIDIKLKENAYSLGLNLQAVMTQVRSAFFGLEAQRIQRGNDDIKLWIRYDESSRSEIKNLDNMKIVTPNGRKVFLKEIANFSINRGDVAINHLDGKREIKITANLIDPNQSASDAVFNIQQNIIPIIEEKYPTIETSFEGQYREANKTIQSSKIVFPLALFLIFCVIGFTFRTYSQPFLLLLLIPFSLTTVAWGHLFHGFPVNVISLLGVIALVGILVNDGLVLISKFNSNLRSGKSYDESLFGAGKERFRAIFLTSITTMAGLAPIIFEKSFQAQLLKPMAISIAYGIGYATFLTLILLPILLSLTNTFKLNFIWLRSGLKLDKRDVEAPVIELKKENK